MPLWMRSGRNGYVNGCCENATARLGQGNFHRDYLSMRAKFGNMAAASQKIFA
jgi:hypothetical protein